MALITRKKKEEKTLYSPEIKETQNAKALSAQLKLFSLQTKSSQLSNGSTRVREF